MAKFIIELPEPLHDRLRMEKIRQKKDIQDIIIGILEKSIK